MAAGGGWAISYRSDVGRGGIGMYWEVWRVDADGRMLTTDRTENAPWYHHGKKAFHLEWGRTSHKERKQAALDLAIAWVANQTGQAIQWAKNRRGDYVPAHVQERFPIPRTA